MQHFSTVAAISTPFGRGGIAVIRISGKDAVGVAEAMFRTAGGKKLNEIPARIAVYGSILRDGAVIDTGIATVFRAPSSFTGEDVVEISCHGGILLTTTVLETAFLCGAEAAGPGEFTKRAFLNGKLTLTEAEGVMDLIDAESEAQMQLASAQSRGRLSAEVERLCGELKRLLASVYAFIDYPDEDLTDVSVEELRAAIEGLRHDVVRLKNSYRSGKAVKEGVKTVIVGKPNTGKSSLLNLLLGEERAIVTDIPGTTRDTVEESATLGRVMLRLCDTAGIREASDEVERIGVERSIAKMQSAELIIGVFDASAPLDGEDREVLARLASMRAEGKQVLYLCNKTDRGEVLSRADFPEDAQVLWLTVRQEGNAAIETLREAVEKRYFDGEISLNEDAVVTNARQYASICAAEEALIRAQDALACGLTQDLAGMDLELALSSLRLTDGRAAAGEIVDEIFSRFCVGK